MTIIILLIIYKGKKHEVSYDSSCKLRDFISDITLKYMGKAILDKSKCIVKFDDLLLNDNENTLYKTLEDIDLEDDDCITLIKIEDIVAGGSWYNKTINIKLTMLYIKLDNTPIVTNVSILGLLWINLTIPLFKMSNPNIMNGIVNINKATP